MSSETGLLLRVPACGVIFALAIVVATISGSEADGLLADNGAGFDANAVEVLETSWRSGTGVDNGLHSAVCSAKRVSNHAEIGCCQFGVLYTCLSA